MVQVLAGSVVQVVVLIEAVVWCTVLSPVVSSLSLLLLKFTDKSIFSGCSSGA